MDPVERPPTVGIVACLLVLATLAWPYLSEPVAAVSAYYATAAITPLAAGLLALVAVIVFAAGRQGRSDPELVAGAGLVFGLFIAGIGLSFAFSARIDVIGGSSALLSYQRWVLAGAALLVPLTSVWYARVLRLF
ncbi:hypothetical protein N0B31_03820 [Salinirubellus salinus]|uniref:Uncharacterized protein n=1 Tax=Salinirubellus salinus TaxID=1364945 RepID=A0A9E7R400_9EURY|nr:hypothetical protein [Salinirubellus salinus]UWM55416.1 hypothetical protein N0B31_03820 [Salinirubellus salinus]